MRDRRREAMTPDQIGAHVSAEFEAATFSLGGGSGYGAIAGQREKALQYYRQELYGDELPGYSQYVTSEVYDTVEFTHADILDFIFSQRKLGFFTPDDQQDEQAADLETEYVHHIIFNQNNAYELLSTFLKDGLLQKNGIAKVYWDERQEPKQETYESKTQEELVLALRGDDVELIDLVIKVNGEEVPQPEELDINLYQQQAMLVAEQMMMAGIEPVITYDFVIEQTADYSRIVIENVAPENFAVNLTHSALCLDDAIFAGELRRCTVSQLVADGLDIELIETLPDYSDDSPTGERATRLDQWLTRGGTSTDPATREVELLEAYPLLDADGDYVAERYKVLCARNGGAMLYHEPVDSQPYVAWSPNPQPYRFYGVGQADEVMPIQRASSVATRNILDNFYSSTKPQRLVRETGNVDMEALLSGSQVVECRDPASDIREVSIPFVADSAYPLLQELERHKEMRTGINKATAGLDPQAFNETRLATAAKLLSAAEKRKKVILRNFIEYGLKPIVLKVHELLRKYETKDRLFKYGGQWRPINPRTWKERTDFKVSVGVGFADSTQKLMAVQEVMALQEKIIGLQQGTGPLLPDYSRVYNALDDYIDESGLSGVDRYFGDPATYQPPPPQSPPVDRALEIEEGKLALQAQIETAKIEMERVKLESEERMQKREIELKTRQLELDLEMKRLQLQIEREKARMAGEYKLADGLIRRKSTEVGREKKEMENESGD